MQFRKFDPQHVFVPAGVQREPVVGNHVCAALRFGQVRQPQARDSVEAQLARRHHAAVAGNDAVVFVNQDRVGKAELADAGGQLRYLRVVVGSAVSRVWHKVGRRERFNRGRERYVCHLAMSPGCWGGRSVCSRGPSARTRCRARSAKYARRAGMLLRLLERP